MKKWLFLFCSVLLTVLLTVPAFAWGDAVEPAPVPSSSTLNVSRSMSIGILAVIIASSIMMVVSLVIVIITFKTYHEMSKNKENHDAAKDAVPADAPSDTVSVECADAAAQDDA